jgi:hypothetical protein
MRLTRRFGVNKLGANKNRESKWGIPAKGLSSPYERKTLWLEMTFLPKTLKEIRKKGPPSRRLKQKAVLRSENASFWKNG